jgi:hypothetical protein
MINPSPAPISPQLTRSRLNHYQQQAPPPLQWGIRITFTGITLPRESTATALDRDSRDSGRDNTKLPTTHNTGTATRVHA